MHISSKSLDAAVTAEIITLDQSQKLTAFWQSQPEAAPIFDCTHILYYLGGMLAIGAMTLFMNLGWQRFGGWGIFFIALLYAVAGLKLTLHFNHRGLSIAAGICAVFVVAMTPLAIYGLQQALGLWHDQSPYRDYHRYIKPHWIALELGTLLVAAIVAWRFRYAFLMMPVAATLWYLSMDTAAMIVGGAPDYPLRQMVSVYFGLGMLAVAIWVDFRARSVADYVADYAFWLYLFGAITFWGGLTMQYSDSEITKLGYFGINLLLLAAGAILSRRVLVILGGLGSCIYLGYLATDMFEDSWLFPIALTAIGLMIIYLGVWWQHNQQMITAKTRKLLPLGIRALLDHRAD